MCVARMYKEVKQRPNCIVEEVVGLSEASNGSH
jgi:hypothetical protein